MKRLPMRRSKLVGSEGPGSLVISPEGETAVVGAIDLWFKDLFDNPILDKSEFEITEPRLKAILKVDKFYTPPEFREQKIGAQESIFNSNIITPLMRFPQWHFCSSCKTLKKFELDSTTAYADCSTCNSKKYFKQVPFITVCEHGHLSDFPWREWAHGDENTTCTHTLKIIMSGGATLDSWKVSCEKCNKSRSLMGVTTHTMGETITSKLGNSLNQGSSAKFNCTGAKPWCGEISEECFAAPVAIFRNSISSYMAKKISAIALPETDNKNVDFIINKIRSNRFIMNNLKLIDQLEKKIQLLRSTGPLGISNNIKDEEIELALLFLESSANIIYTEEETEQPEKTLRKKEFENLIKHIDCPTLRIEPEWVVNESNGSNYYTKYLERLSRVLRLKETTALYGFDRLNYNQTSNFSGYYSRLYKDFENAKEKWLPVHEVYGEGIFLQLNQEQLDIWESNTTLQQYFQGYLNRVEHVAHRNDSILNPRNIMLHTLSHFLIDEFANTSGYNRASIRERLYLDKGQCGVLIYISAGDSEGTLGGLVRLGLKDSFFHSLDNARIKASWCSSDPVCTELGSTIGQGINSLNGAACYNCSHIPETSCELWNTYLDRRLLTDPEFGYFNS